jgi:hypothetical protein
MRAEVDSGFQRLADLARNQRTRDIVQLLAIDAAIWVAAERSVLPPPAVSVRQVERELLSSDMVTTNHSLLESLCPDDLGSYVPELVGSLSGNWYDAHVGSPSLDQVARTLLVPLSDQLPNAVSIFDCAAGIGSSLTSAATAARSAGSEVRIFAQEIDHDVAALAELNFFISNLTAQVEVGDSLTTDRFAGQKVDLAVSQAPWGMSWGASSFRIQALHGTGEAFPFGLPRKSDSSWLFAQRAIQKLKTQEEGGGRAVVFLNGSALRSNNGAHIRRAIVESDLLDIAVALPGGLAPFTEAPTYALVFDTAKPDRRRGSVRLVDLRSQFESNKTRTSSQWRLTEQGSSLLQASVRTSKDSDVARTVSAETFLTERYSLSRPSSTNVPLEWNIEVPRGQNPLAFARDRYPNAIDLSINTSVRATEACRIDIEAFFEPDYSRRWARARGWKSVRLTSLLEAPPLIGGAEGQYVPRNIGFEAFTAGETDQNRADVEQSRRAEILVQVDPSVALPGYLNWWMRSPSGADSLDRARRSTERAESARALTHRQLIQMLDRISVPLPALIEQAKIVGEEAKLHRLESLVSRSRGQYWDDPTQEISLLRKIDELLDDPPEAWAHDLPYPLAAALWTLHTKDSPEAKHTQIFLFWEAYAAFSATTVLSALAVDDSLFDTIRPELDRLLRNGGGSLEQASFGTWFVTFEFLSATFRRMLNSNENGEQNRASRLFGGIPTSSLSRILSPAVVDLIRDANAKRNVWAGHSGASNPPELKEHIEYMEVQIEKLRTVVGDAWKHLRLVRARSATQRDGVITQTVESLLGPSTPFRIDNIRVQNLMESDRLYLISPPSEQAVRLYPFVVMQSAPASQKSTSYFYSRRTAIESFRFVSYETADQSEIVITDPQMNRAVRSAVNESPVTSIELTP